MSVGWGGNDCKVFSYNLQDDGSLNGLWTTVGETALGTEDLRLTNQNMQDDLTGTYDVIGTNPDGSAYHGQIEITMDADVYQWIRKSDDVFSGVGLWRSNMISVAYGGENCSVVSYLVHDDGALDSIWAFVDSSDLGSEAVTPSDGDHLVEEISTEDTIELAVYEDDIEPNPSDGCGTIQSKTNSPNDAIDMQVGILIVNITCICHQAMTLKRRPAWCYLFMVIAIMPSASSMASG